jgi:uncharacterized protein (DUF2147 family)
MTAKAALLCLAAMVLAAAAPPPEVGQWLTQDHTTVVDITECSIGLCGRLVGLTEREGATGPVKDVWGRPECGETIIRMNRQQAGGLWTGTVLDPRNGSTYQAQLWDTARGLHLRGYIGLPVFGGTQIWTPYGGPMAPNCDFSQQAGAARAP